jgi:hypothetical protein
MLGEVPEAGNDIFKQNRFNDPDCNASKKAMGMLPKSNKQGFGSLKPLLQRGVFGFSKFGH